MEDLLSLGADQLLLQGVNGATLNRIQSLDSGENGITTPDNGRGFNLATDADLVPDPELSQAEVDDLAFFLLNLPHFVMRVQSDIITTFQLQPTRNAATHIWQEVALLLYYLNFSANFFISFKKERNGSGFTNIWRFSKKMSYLA